MGRPETITIDHDDYHAEFVGITSEGNQFFLTNPFEPASSDQEGCEYLALFVFDAAGSLIKSEIEVLGPRKSLNKSLAREKHAAKLKSLGNVEYGKIVVKPFSVHQDGVDFGLIVRVPEEEEDVWAVELLPGNYMAFFEPWDSGEYDT